ncbi:right-handed parallel beta-helix repeat-containing protein [Promicromonospora sp. CA-289599]|uniref:right-handed parallel beta-helix repeat-containing protein n=1 Tax=Promicromonospora sp. CA-289599 TaxID=3240014 RepID=UPI003D9367D1
MTLMSRTREVSVRRKGRWRAAAGSVGAAALLLSGLGTSIAQAAPPQKDTVYYASPDGRDHGRCQEKHPCSLEHVQGVVRHAAAKGKGDVTVVLADGTYRIDRPLEFRTQDGGRRGHTVRWTAAEGAHPEITGSTQLTGWEQYDEAANIYVADTPVGLETRQLYVDGVAAPRASTSLELTDLTLTPTGMTIDNPELAYLADLPDQDRIEFESLGDFTDRYSPVQSIEGSTITMTQPAWDNNTWGWDTVQYSLLAESKWFLANSLGFLDEAGEWYVDPDAGKLYYKPADGVDPRDLDVELPRVETLVSVGGTYDAPVSNLEFSGLTFTGTSWLGPSSNEGYVSQQNGGYLKGEYDYRPADAFTSCSRGCEAYERTRNTWFQEPSAVQVSAADHITFERNTFRNLGSSGLGIGNDDNATLTGIGLGASNIDVTGNVFTHVGGHALFVGGLRADAHHPSDPRMTNQDIRIENNTISHVAVEYQDNSGILSTYVTRAQIVNNEVANLPYAIDTGFGWGINDAGGSQEYVRRGYYKHNPLYQTPTTLKDNLIAGNLVRDIKPDFADSGNIYNLSASPGTVIENNYMYNVSGVGIYLDEGSRYILSRHNVLSGSNPWVFTNAYSAGNGTNDNTLQENWYNSGGAQIPNAEERNNRLIDNVQVSGNNWPSAAWEVICAAGVAPEYRTELNANLGGIDPRCETAAATETP